MEKFQYIIKDKDGVHARPAGTIIKKASSFKSEIKIIVADKEVRLKGGIFALLGLGIKCGTEVTITCEGEDEQIAAKEMLSCFEENI